MKELDKAMTKLKEAYSGLYQRVEQKPGVDNDRLVLLAQEIDRVRVTMGSLVAL